MKRILILFLIIAGLGLASCNKKGCTNACAYNYNEQAEKDDGTCVIKKPKVTFWSDGNTHGTINIAIDSNKSGEIELGEYFGTLAFGFNSPPICGQYNTVSVELFPGTYLYHAWASDNKTVWDGTFVLNDCDCTSVFLPD